MGHGLTAHFMSSKLVINEMPLANVCRSCVQNWQITVINIYDIISLFSLLTRLMEQILLMHFQGKINHMSQVNIENKLIISNVVRLNNSCSIR